MKNLSTVIVCGLFVLSLTLACNDGRYNPIAPDEAVVEAPSDITGLLKFDESRMSNEYAVEAMADLIIFSRDNLASANRRNKLTETEFISIKRAQNKNELQQAIGSAGGNPDRVLHAFNEFQKIARFLKNEKFNIDQFTKEVVREVSKKSLERRLANLKSPDCAGGCSQQFSLDMQSCENELALGIAGSLIVGGASGGMAGAGGFIITIGMYFNCENNAFSSLDVCATGCGI